MERRLYRLVKQGVYYFRRLVASRDAPDAPALFAPEAEPAEVKRVLGGYYFSPAWLLSYHYYGETMNMRRVEYDAGNPLPWRQFHIRGYKQEDGTLLQPHIEPEPVQYPGAHRRHDAETEDAVKRLGVLLRRENIDHYRRRVP